MTVEFEHVTGVERWRLMVDGPIRGFRFDSTDVPSAVRVGVLRAAIESLSEEERLELLRPYRFDGIAKLGDLPFVDELKRRTESAEAETTQVGRELVEARATIDRLRAAADVVVASLLTPSRKQRQRRPSKPADGDNDR